jgi:hypothetical protein
MFSRLEGAIFRRSSPVAIEAIDVEYPHTSTEYPVAVAIADARPKD